MQSMCSLANFIQDMDEHFPLKLVYCYYKVCRTGENSVFFTALHSTVNQRNITSDFNDLHATIQDIRLACQKMPATAEDRFAVVMSVSSHQNLKSADMLHSRKFALEVVIF